MTTSTNRMIGLAILCSTILGGALMVTHGDWVGALIATGMVMVLLGWIWLGVYFLTK